MEDETELMSYGEVDQIREALKKDPTLASTQNGKNCNIHSVSRCNSAEALDLLVECGADINTLNEDKRSPLHEACDSGNVSTAARLISLGADLNGRDKRGFTPLALAISTKTPEGVEISGELISAGAKKDLQVACLFGDLPLVAKILQEFRNIPDFPDHDTLLLNTYQGGEDNILDRVKIVELLFDRGLRPYKSTIKLLINMMTQGNPNSKNPYLTILSAHYK